MSASYNDLKTIDGVYLVIPPVIQALVYGAYIILFCQCMHIFRKRQQSGGRKIFLTGTIFLFIICTLQCASNFIPRNMESLRPIADITINFLYVLANLIADILFIYRCHIIWGRKKFIFYVLLLIIFVNFAFGTFISLFIRGPIGGYRGLAQASLYTSLAINIGVTLLSASRIWWISRRLKMLGPQVTQKYNTAMGLIIESGAIYCVAIIAYIVSTLHSTRKSAIVFDGMTISAADISTEVFFGILVQIVGIVPTLIVVRIGLGISTEDAQTAILVSRIGFDHGEDNLGGTTTNRQTMISINNIRYTTITDIVTGAEKVQI
ncbi:hypothetical protein BDZ94DRAFT_1277229 [Collybia nuda]|uniref:Uncharacterized protein n=1 Tax=Collybia nuda TaxID=64659 RepID=A0A9P6C839_9AGAR|nr:hypothetical protein BDZ94DRAFT_1277229 [Collybia nuda]